MFHFPTRFYCAPGTCQALSEGGPLGRKAGTPLRVGLREKQVKTSQSKRDSGQFPPFPPFSLLSFLTPPLEPLSSFPLCLSPPQQAEPLGPLEMEYPHLWGNDMMPPLAQPGGMSHNLQERDNEIVLSRRPAARSSDEPPTELRPRPGRWVSGEGVGGCQIQTCES